MKRPSLPCRTAEVPEFCRRPLWRRAASAVLRRWRTWTPWTARRDGPDPQHTFHQLQAVCPSGVPLRPGGDVCPAWTSEAVRIAWQFGQDDLARRWLEWLLRQQRPDGGLGEGMRREPSLHATAQLLFTLLETDLPDRALPQAARRAADYLASRIDHRGRLQPATGSATSVDRWASGLAHLAVPAALHRAADRFDRPTWRDAARRAIERTLHTIESAAWEPPLRLAVRAVTALMDTPWHAEALAIHRAIAAFQARDGRVPAALDQPWVCCESVALLAQCWFRLGEDHRGDAAMAWLAGRRKIAGWLPARFPSGKHGRPVASLAATLHFLEARRLQVRCTFAHQAAALPAEIDPADGRCAAVLEALSDLPPGARVADVGCGKGRYLHRLAQCFPHLKLTGIDAVPEVLAWLPAEAEARTGSLLRLPADDAAFDAALAVESLEHALLPCRAVAELCRVVRPGGRVVVVDKDRTRQPLSHHQPWERWFTAEVMAAWLSPWCTAVQCRRIAHGPADQRGGLFLLWTARRRQSALSRAA